MWFAIRKGKAVIDEGGATQRTTDSPDALEMPIALAIFHERKRQEANNGGVGSKPRLEG
jgi:hypothetical protein